MRTGTLLSLLLLGGLLATAPAAASTADDAEPAAARACERIVDPFPRTRFAEVDITRIRAVGVSCTTARRVARRAQRKALGLPVPVSGIRRFMWRGWSVRGDLRGDHDFYVASRGAKRVRWRF